MFLLRRLLQDGCTIAARVSVPVFTLAEKPRRGEGMKAAVIIYPGSNCDRDCKVALERSVGADVSMVWHKETTLPEGLDLIVLPGGFSYGDYLRCGAMAALSPVTRAVVDAAKAGVPVLGICNGFQVLCEAGLLPGALLRNASLKYVCKPVALEVTNNDTPFTRAFSEGEDVVMTVGNGEGNYFAEDAVLDALEQENRIAFRYRQEVNGSQRRIAGIVDPTGRIMGLMPHPDRAFEAELGSADGARVFQSLLAA
ncbi:phosphoribosylformylglycinamidine synthase subunit PurQ [Candidatus Phycosocius bacilliformis]|uniref:Phosphoribosylformylglycinamidine synthase subunit PurQ n=2 Tax=Candidatus Phycosocius bacilliformis TaxID=1445552 RepID=A0A2P2EE06_9PROT|nr:phosphoribosylformylglycinamidine synthase subunit PurQ [Candidatus Phycosocius bacilliformis]